MRIAREALTGAGLDEQVVEAGRAAWIRAAGEAFVADEDSAREWHIAPGLAAALRQLGDRGMHLSLLTGNLRAIAVAKIERMGLTGVFDLAIGAYGDDAEARAMLVQIAGRRASSRGDSWPRERTVIVGDTPEDVAIARADGVASVMFASPRYPKAALAGAGAVVCDVDGLLAALEVRAPDGPRSGIANLVAEDEAEEAQQCHPEQRLHDTDPIEERAGGGEAGRRGGGQL